MSQTTQSGSRVPGGREAPSVREWNDARAVEQSELGVRRSVATWLGLGVAVVVAGLAPAVYPASPGYSSSNTPLVVLGAVVAAVVALAIVPIAFGEFRRRADLLLYGACLLSAGAAAIHFAVAKEHFEEYALFGVFFVLSGIAQLAWAVLAAARPRRWILATGVAGNLAIVALWAFDRIWGLPLGPEHWKPDPLGFGDVTASAFEVVLAAACIALLRGRDARSRYRLAVPVVVLTTFALLSVMGIGSPVITPSM
jgi:uncharacterized membrane protein HdeD (DUF308 family)